MKAGNCSVEPDNCGSAVVGWLPWLKGKAEGGPLNGEIFGLKETERSDTQSSELADMELSSP